MCSCNEEAHRFRVVVFEHFANEERVAQRFGHFLVVHPHESVVNPDINELPWCTRWQCAFGLRDFIFMVRKLQILAAAVDVDMAAEQLRRHGRAFDMPSRPAVAPGRFPERLAFLRPLPQDEVQWILLRSIHFDPLARS